jgi:hypothetical protein
MKPPGIISFIDWVTEKNGKIEYVQVTRGKIHNCLGMKLDYSTPGQVSIDMKQQLWRPSEHAQTNVSEEKGLRPERDLFKSPTISRPLICSSYCKVHDVCYVHWDIFY